MKREAEKMRVRRGDVRRNGEGRKRKKKRLTSTRRALMIDTEE